MSTATSVPPTVGLEGDDALRDAAGHGAPAARCSTPSTASAPRTASATRARSASSSRSRSCPRSSPWSALATALDQDTFTRVVREVLADITPGAAGDLVTDALRQGSASSRGENGELALVTGGFADPRGGHDRVRPARARREPHLRRRARPPAAAQVRHGGRCCSSPRASRGVLAAILLVAGETLADAAGLGRRVQGRALAARARAARRARSRCSSRSRRGAAQPEASWLARRLRRCPRCCGSSFTGAPRAADRRDGELRRDLRAAGGDDRRAAVDAAHRARAPPRPRVRRPARGGARGRDRRRASSARRTSGRASRGRAASSRGRSRRACARAAPPTSSW